MLARRLPPPPTRPPFARPQVLRRTDGALTARAEGRWRRAGRRPTRSPRGQAVHWWDRPAPRGDEALWQAVRRLQAERIRTGLTVTDLARRLEASGRPLRRETLSRILQGKQATTWETAEALAQALGVDLDDIPAPGRGRRGGDPD